MDSSNLKPKKANVILLNIFYSLMAWSFGSTLAVFNVNLDAFLTQMNLIGDENQALYSSLLGSIIFPGALLGTLFGKSMMQKGRWNTIVLIQVLNVIASILCINANYWVVVVGRFLCGFSALGISIVLVPKLIEETAPPSMKASLGGLTQTFITLGIVTQFVLGLWAPTEQADLETSNHWKICVLLVAFESVFVLVCVLTVFRYETPFFAHYALKDDQQTEKILKFLYEEESLQDAKDFIKNSRKEGDSSKVTFIQGITHPNYRGASWIGFFCVLFQQLSGISGVMAFSNLMLQEIGDFNAAWGNVIIGLLHQVACFISLFTLDKFGRKFLLIQGHVICTVSLALVSIGVTMENTFVTILGLFAFNFFFDTSSGPVCYVYISETCNDAGLALGMLSQWIFGFVAVSMTPIIIDSSLGIAGLFWIFSIITFISVLFFAFVLKETRGLSDDECKELFSATKYITEAKQQVEMTNKGLQEDGEKPSSKLSNVVPHNDVKVTE